MTVKTCITCVYKRGSLCTKQWAQPPGEKVDLVTGVVTRNEGMHFSCETQRRYVFNSCGAKGLWWTPITPIKPAKERANDAQKPKQQNIMVRAFFRLLRVFK